MKRPPSQRGCLSAAARAFDAIWPAAGNEISLAGFLIGESRLELSDGHLMDGLGATAAHGVSSQRERNIAWPI
jgi:hypothetical protein